MRSKPVAAGIAALVAAAAGPPPALAVHWPYFGGDNGRSGNQPVDEGTTPLGPVVFEKTGADEDAVRTSVVTTAGAPEAQRLAFGTLDEARGGVVHLQLLTTGAPVGPEAGTDIDEGAPDADVFGVPGGGNSVSGFTRGSSVSFADTSGPAGLGQLFVVHNDDAPTDRAPDVEIAQIDEATGSVVTQVDVAGTDDFTVDSSAVATGPDGDGNRSLFFIARTGGAAGSGVRLFKLTIGSAASPTAVIGTATSVEVEATAGTSPTIVSLPVGGTPVAHIAVGTIDDQVETYRVSDLVPGPKSPTLGGDAQTPSVPVQPNGLTPGPGQPVGAAPAIYVATQRPGTPGGGTVVQRLSAVDLSVQATSNALGGDPASALAVTQRSEPAPGQGQVVVTTGSNVFVLGTADLTSGVVSRFPTGIGTTGGTPGTTGFLQNTAAVSGGLVYVSSDHGTQHVLRLADAQPVAAGDFTPDPDAGTTTFGAFGQPSLSRGFVQFGGPSGVFVHRNADASDPTVTLAEPGAEGSVRGTITLAAVAYDARGLRDVALRLDGQPLAVLATPASGSPLGPPGARYETRLDTTRLPNRAYTFDAVATDAQGRTTVTPGRVLTVDNPPPPPPPPDDEPRISFISPPSGEAVRDRAVVAATATDDRGVRSVTFSIGTQTICTDTAAPYACVLRLRPADIGDATLTAVVRDTAGQTATATRAIVVGRLSARSLAASVSPGRDSRAPYRFVTRGRVRPPAGVPAAQACRRGRVSVTFRTGSRTLSTRRASLDGCAFQVTTTFRDGSRFAGSRSLRVSVRFGGTAVLAPRVAPVRSVRVR